MSLAKEIMGGGFSAGSARAILGTVSSAISAAGSTIADATALKAGHNIVSTVSSGQGVQLYSGVIGDEQFVYNGTTTPLTVYPDSSSATINQLGAGVGVLVGAYTGAKFKKATSTSWTAWLSA